MLGALRWMGLATFLAQAQGPSVDPAAGTADQAVAASAGQPPVAQRANRLPVFNLKTQGQWTIDQLVRHVREQMDKDKTGTQTVNIVMGPGVGELKAPADLELVNVTPLGVFAAIASVEPQLGFAPLSTPGGDLTIAVQLRPGARDQGGAKDIKLRVFRLPPPSKTLEADADTVRKQQDEALNKLQNNVAELMHEAASLRGEAGGEGTSKSFMFRVHRSTRTVLVAGTAEDLELAQEVLTALGATPSSSGRAEDPNSNKPARAF
jgi:hypothetical protein